MNSASAPVASKIIIGRRTWRLILGSLTALVVSFPTWVALPTPAGQKQLDSRWATLHHNLSLLNVLGEVNQISITTRQVVGVNHHIVQTLKEMDSEENQNQALKDSLTTSSRQLQQQVNDIVQLDRLTGQQEPLSLSIGQTTQAINREMSQVDGSASQEARTMRSVAALGSAEEALMARLLQMNQAILSGELDRAEAITQNLAGGQ